jgi:hypothetical protein
MPIKVSVLWHKEVTEQEHIMFLAKLKLSLKQVQDIMLISNISFPDYIPGRGVGYDRDFLLQQATQDFCYFIDQDNEFESDHFERMVGEYRSQGGANILLSPTIERRKSGNIQSRGILRMYYLFPKYVFNKNQSHQGFSQVQMIGANSLFGPTKAMQSL